MAELTPDKPALLFRDRRITYQDLSGGPDRTACWLQSLGIEKGTGWR